MATITLESIRQVESLLPALRGCVARCATVEAGEKFTDSLGGEVLKVYSAQQKSDCEAERAAKLAEVQGLVAGWTA